METGITKPSNNLVWAILTTLLCCLPTGIVAIVYACKVDTFWVAEKYHEAEDASKNARMWILISVGIGIAYYITILAIYMLGIGIALLE